MSNFWLKYIVVSSLIDLFGPICNHTAERILDPKERVLDVLAAWEKAPEEEEVKEVAPAAKAKAGQVLAQHEEKTKVIKGPQYK